MHNECVRTDIGNDLPRTPSIGSLRLASRAIQWPEASTPFFCGLDAWILSQGEGDVFFDGMRPRQTGHRWRLSSVFVDQEFVTASKQKKPVAVESAEVNRLSWNYQAEVQRALNDVRIRYDEVLDAEKSLAVAGRMMTIAEEGLSMTEQLLEARQVTRADVLQARIQLKTIRLTVRSNSGFV